MAPEPDHLFWLKRWKAAHDLETRRFPRICFQMVPTLAMLNYATYLICVFSFMMEQKLKPKGDLDVGRQDKRIP